MQQHLVAHHAKEELSHEGRRDLMHLMGDKSREEEAADKRRRKGIGRQPSLC